MAKAIKIVIEFTKLNLENFTESPFSIDADEVLRIDYGNFGNVNDRHWWPGLYPEDISLPVIIIHTNGYKFIATDSLKFRHIPVKQLPDD